MVDDYFSCQKAVRITVEEDEERQPDVKKQVDDEARRPNRAARLAKLECVIVIFIPAVFEAAN